MLEEKNKKNIAPIAVTLIGGVVLFCFIMTGIWFVIIVLAAMSFIKNINLIFYNISLKM